jgi:HSP20 family protein
MSNKALTRATAAFPNVFDNFFKPWSEFFETGNVPGRMATVPAVNIVENNSDYKVSLAAPGLTKDDFTIDVADNMLTISSEKEEQKESQEKQYTRKEYSYSSFSRSFALPENVKQEAIEARYENGVLQLTLPKKEASAAGSNSKKIPVV